MGRGEVREGKGISIEPVSKARSHSSSLRAIFKVTKRRREPVLESKAGESLSFKVNIVDYVSSSQGLFGHQLINKRIFNLVIFSKHRS